MTNPFKVLLENYPIMLLRACMYTMKPSGSGDYAAHYLNCFVLKDVTD